MALSLALILAAALAPAAAAAPAPVRPAPARPIDRSLSDSDRLSELRIAVTAALDKGEIDPPTATQFYFDIERIRRHMIRLGIQVGYRQKVALRERIDRLQARWEQRRAMNAAVR